MNIELLTVKLEFNVIHVRKKIVMNEQYTTTFYFFFFTHLYCLPANDDTCSGQRDTGTKAYCTNEGNKQLVFSC